jgi:hypothetical protein
LLRNLAQKSAQDCLFLTAELLKVVKAFEAHGIEVVPYKGPALAATLYQSLTIRPFSDLDVLVRERDVRAAAEILLADGFRGPDPFGAGEDLNPRIDRPYWQSFDAPDRGRIPVRVELHWRLPLTFSLDQAAYWSRLRWISLMGTPVRQFAHEDLLVILCAHGFKHLWVLIKWISDIGELIRVCPDLDWDGLYHRARMAGSSRVIGVALALAHDLLHAELPPPARRFTDHASIRAVVRTVRTRLFVEQRLPVGVVKNLRIRERWRDRAQYCAGLASYIMTPQALDRAELALPSPLSFLYYPLRPVLVARRMVRKYGGLRVIRDFWN